MKYYKVVNESNGVITSAVIGKYKCWGDPEDILSLKRFYELTYIPNEWVYPIAGTRGIFVFRELRYAQNFLAANTGTANQLWECEVKQPRRFPVICSNFHSEAFQEFWQEIDKIKQKRKSVTKILERFKTCESPCNTYLASAVKLTQKVENDRIPWSM